MKLRGLIVAAIILAGLSGALYWSDHHKPTATTEASADVPPKILAVKEADISKVELKKNGAEQVGLERNSAGKWQIVSPTSLAADQSAVSSLLGTFSSLNSQRVVEEKAANLAPYGLNAPKLEVDLTGKENKKLLLGDDTPAGNGIYAKLDGDPRVFTIPSYDKTSIDKSANDLRDKRLLTVDADKISQVELVSKKQEMAFGRNKDEWQIVKPKPLRADGSEVDDLVRALADARMELDGSDDQNQKKTASIFASSTPVATAKVTAESGTQELQVRKNKDDYYAKSSVVEGIYKVPATLGQQLAKNFEDFRNKKLFDLGTDDPGKIEFREGSKISLLTRSGEDWWSGSAKKMDAGTVQELIDKIRDLAASKFVDSGFTAGLIDLTVTSNGGKRVEKVAISKAGDSYVAKRENDPTLYQLDSKAVDDLRKSADEVKPAAIPGK